MNDAADASQIETARVGAAIFDLDRSGLLEISGTDRRTFLHNFCTNDINQLEPGDGCEAFLVNVKGRVIGHAFVFAGDQVLTLHLPAAPAAPLVEHLERYLITEDVELADRGGERAVLYVSGPESTARLAAAGLDPGDLDVMSGRPVSTGSCEATLRRVDWLGSPGTIVDLPLEAGQEAWTALLATGAVAGDDGLFESLRIEALLPVIGIDVTDKHLAPEVDRDARAISYTKGCYLGQEPIARINAMGHVNRLLRGISWEGPERPPAGCPVTAPTGEKTLGNLSSVSPLPAPPGRPRALAIIRREVAEPGTAVSLDTSDGPLPAVVVG